MRAAKNLGHNEKSAKSRTGYVSDLNGSNEGTFTSPVLAKYEIAIRIRR